jgi:hypothetical protein
MTDWSGYLRDHWLGTLHYKLNGCIKIKMKVGKGAPLGKTNIFFKLIQFDR